MNRFSRSHLSDAELLRSVRERVAELNRNGAKGLVYLGEIEARKLYLPTYRSMLDLCVAKFRLAENEAQVRIEAARAARRFPAILDAVAEGRLHVEGVALLASVLTPENAGRLLAAAERKSEAEIRKLIRSCKRT